ncbi:MAG: 50S ribosomal protein L6 [Bacteroidales bacterium]
MSRIGKLPVHLPQGVAVDIDKDNVVKVKGPKGEMSLKVDPDIKLELKDGALSVARPTDDPTHRSLHGLYRALINNMVTGVSKGFETQQELVGVGYRVDCQNNILTFSLGFSHDIQFQLPKEVTAEVPQVKKGQNPVLILRSYDKQVLGMVAARVRAIRRPEPYKGKGIKYVGEEIRRKAGKTAAAK